jgi:flagellar biosynthesis/type III secretory pathway protein FliH
MPQPYAKFAFDTEFGGSFASPRNTQKALDDARNEGYAAGLAEGRKQAQAEVEALSSMAQQALSGLQASLQEREAQMAQQTLSLLRLTLHHLLGHAISHYPDELLEHHLKSVQPLLRQDETLVLHIHPNAQGFHDKLKLPQAQILGLPMQIVPDANLGLSDVVVEWRGGGVESKLAQHWENLSTLLQGAGAVAAPVPQFSTETAPKEPDVADILEKGVTPENKALRSRAAELLGEDDELVDALK